MRDIEKKIEGYFDEYIHLQMSLVNSEGKSKAEIEKLKEECLKIFNCINNTIQEIGIKDSELALETSNRMFLTLYIIEIIKYIKQEVGDVDIKSAWNFCEESLKFKDEKEFKKRLTDYIEQLKSQGKTHEMSNPKTDFTKRINLAPQNPNSSDIGINPSNTGTPTTTQGERED